MRQFLKKFDLKITRDPSLIRTPVKRAIVELPLWRLLIFVGWGLCLLNAEDSSQGEVVDRIRKAVETLHELPTGEILLKKSLRSWKHREIPELIPHFKWGDSSRTDTVLTRHYNPKTGAEEREREVTLFLKEDQTDVELALDLAHELVHATAHPSFDPYDSSLTAGKYIRAALEGEGGEVEAVITECQIGHELSLRLGVSIARCEDYLSTNAKGEKRIERNKVLNDFYRVGNWKGKLLSELGEEARSFPLLSQDSPKFYSSTGHAPYPVVLFKEFEEITNAACDNTRKRMTSVASREPANQSEGQLNPINPEKQQDIRKFIQSRCK